MTTLIAIHFRHHPSIADGATSTAQKGVQNKSFSRQVMKITCFFMCKRKKCVSLPRLTLNVVFLDWKWGETQ